VKGIQLELGFEDKRRLFERILETNNLKIAFKRVKANKGAPGIDGMTIEEYEQNLEEELNQLKEEVQSWSYKPTPVKRVEIPKPNGKGTRNLGIPIIKDRVLHMAIKQVLEPILEPTFSENSYGFRPGRNQQQAVQKAKHIVESGKEFVVDIDLSKFFDRINHDRLIHRLRTHVDDTRVLRLIGMILRSGVMIDGIKTPTEEGSVQGSPLSPLLSNVVLDELDKELEQRGLEFCRFADDCNIFTKTERAAERIMTSIKKFIEKKLKLKVNEDKSKTAKSDQVKFLGMTIVKATIAISKAALSKAMEKVKELIPRGTNLAIEQTVEKINSWYRGWASYFKMTQYPAQLKSIEAHIRRRLRARSVSQQKKKRNLVAKLIKRGVAKKQAVNTVYTNRKTWALSHTKAVEKAFPNRWFSDTLNQIIMSDKKLDHWFSLDVWVKLA
jgi:group II intron reverse transcriptase/maturase